VRVSGIAYRGKDEAEISKFIRKNIPGLKSLEHDDAALTILVKYEPASPFDYVIKNIISKEPELRLSKDDISSYVAPVLTNRITKALWLIAVLGVKVGFLQFSVSSMIVNRYIKARFG
jgi:hypothetical protein